MERVERAEPYTENGTIASHVTNSWKSLNETSVRFERDSREDGRVYVRRALTELRDRVSESDERNGVKEDRN